MDLVSHAEMRELLGAYAVHALEDNEFESVTAHLDGCDRCRDEVDDLLDASASLGLSDLQPPSMDLWKRIAADVRAIPTAERSEGSGQPGAAAASAPTTRRLIAPVIAMDAAREARRDRQSKWRIGAASAAAAIALAVPITSMMSGSPAPSLAALATQAAGEDGARLVALRGTDGTAFADVVVTRTGRGYLRHSVLPELPQGRTYQLWAVAGKEVVSAGVLGRHPDVSAFTVDTKFSALALTVEPETGSVVATTKPMASATVDI